MNLVVIIDFVVRDVFDGLFDLWVHVVRGAVAAGVEADHQPRHSNPGTACNPAIKKISSDPPISGNSCFNLILL